MSDIPLAEAISAAENDVMRLRKERNRAEAEVQSAESHLRNLYAEREKKWTQANEGKIL